MLQVFRLHQTYLDNSQKFWLMDRNISLQISSVLSELREPNSYWPQIVSRQKLPDSMHNSIVRHVALRLT